MNQRGKYAYILCQEESVLFALWNPCVLFVVGFVGTTIAAKGLGTLTLLFDS